MAWNVEESLTSNFLGSSFLVYLFKGLQNSKDSACALNERWLFLLGLLLLCLLLFLED